MFVLGMYFQLSVYLSVYLSICLSVYLSICLSVYLSINFIDRFLSISIFCPLIEPTVKNYIKVTFALNICGAEI
jgi:hypothetical protein